MFLQHDQTHGKSGFMTSQIYGQTREQVFALNCGTHYSDGYLVTPNEVSRLPGQKLEFYVTIFLFTHHNNVLIIFFYTSRSAQFNMRGPMCQQDGIKFLILKVRMHFVGNLLSTLTK